MAGGAFKVDWVTVSYTACRLVVFADSRDAFVDEVASLGVDLPQGWKRTHAVQVVSHSCMDETLVHLGPLYATLPIVGLMPDLAAVIADAEDNPKRGPYHRRLDYAVTKNRDVRTCKFGRPFS